MRPNLSVEKIAGALAVLGASVLISACGGDEKSSEDRATEAQRAMQEGMQKERQMYEGMQKGVETLEKKTQEQETKK